MARSLLIVARMGHPLRMFDPDTVYLITNRCHQASFLLKPEDEVNQLIGGVIARAQRLYGITIYSFGFLSNHFHIILRGQPTDIVAFMRHIKCNISKEIGPFADWRGAFWERRYTATPVLDKEALLERLRYVVAHGVKEDLVEKCAQWPGLTTLPELTTSEERYFPWVDRTKLFNLRRSGKAVKESDAITMEKLVISPLPCCEERAPEARRKWMLAFVEGIELEHKRRREAEGKQVLGVAAIRAQDRRERPRRPKRSPRVPCHTTSPQLREEYIRRYRQFCADYQEASARYRAGDLSAKFPPYSFPPPLPCVGLHN